MTLSPLLRAELSDLGEACARSLGAELRERLPRQGVEPRLEWRIKTPSSIAYKLERRRAGGRKDDFINDLVGFRIVVSHAGLVPQTVTVLLEWLGARPAFQVREIGDFFQEPASALYRAVHVDADFVDPTSGHIASIGGFEFQITTYLQNYMASISHDLHYEKHGVTANNAATLDSMRNVLHDIQNLDQDVAALFSVLKTS